MKGSNSNSNNNKNQKDRVLNNLSAWDPFVFGHVRNEIPFEFILNLFLFVFIVSFRFVLFQSGEGRRCCDGRAPRRLKCGPSEMRNRIRHHTAARIADRAVGSIVVPTAG